MVSFFLPIKITKYKGIESLSQTLSLSFKYQKFTPSVYPDIEIRKFEFVAKIQFLNKKKY